ncbi:MAG: TonB-dependent receptor [Burkholderiales bacterium]|nr:TonB-dependent receptor [Burkholderiales bacterium]
MRVLLSPGRLPRASACSLLVLAMAAGAAHADDESSSAGGGGIQNITVTAERLAKTRNEIQTQTGASTYVIGSDAIQALPGGENLPLNEVLLQAPGVAQDSFGQIHIRGEHNNLQYRLNGIILPEGISVFGQSLSPRLADQVELITGALPAEYGLRTAGIIDMTTKSGVFTPGGEVSFYGGSHGTIQPSFEYGGSAGQFNYFVSGSYLQNGLGIESPDGRSDPLHDKTQQGSGFGYFEYLIDSDSKASLIVGASRNQFQIPDQAGLQPSLGYTLGSQTNYPSDQLNESQREITDYAVLSYLKSVTDDFHYQVSLFGRYSSLLYTPDVAGDLLYNGVAQYAYKQDTAGGIQTEGVYHLTPAHTLRAGFIIEGDRGTSTTTSEVFPLDPVSGAQVGTSPITIPDNGGKLSWTYSAYLQDEWKLADQLTINYGGRFDVVDAYTHAWQFSPRVNAVWKPLEDTTVHAGYSRYFTPPPFELVGGRDVNLFANTSGASTVTLDSTPKAERANYYDIGISQVIVPGLTVGWDNYYKSSTNLIDEGQFGAPIILTPFDYAKGKQYGSELSVSYQVNPFTFYANFAAARAIGKDIVSSQFNFTPDDLAYISQHWIHLDHDQTYTASGGVSYRWEQTRISADLISQSGLRASTDVPNGTSLSHYVTVNLGLTQGLDLAALGAIKLRFDVINLLDKDYEIRNGTGVGVGAPQFGARRGFFGGISKEF